MMIHTGSQNPSVTKTKQVQEVRHLLVVGRDGGGYMTGRSFHPSVSLRLGPNDARGI